MNLQEKTIADTKELIKGLNPTVGDFSLLEERIMYFAMLKQIRHDHIELLGISPQYSYGLTDTERMQVLSNLTEEQKTVIRRDFIQNTLREAFRNGITEDLLMEFANQHDPEGVAEIKAKHAEVYDKRHARIIEKIEAIQAEQVQAEPETVAEQPTQESNPFAD